MSGGEQQRESATYAEADDPDPAGAAVVAGQPGTRGVDVVGRPSRSGERVAEERAQVPDGSAPVEQVRREREESGAGLPIRLAVQVLSQARDVVYRHDV